MKTKTQMTEAAPSNTNHSVGRVMKTSVLRIFYGSSCIARSTVLDDECIVVCSRARNANYERAEMRGSDEKMLHVPSVICSGTALLPASGSASMVLV